MPRHAHSALPVRLTPLVLATVAATACLATPKTARAPIFPAGVPGSAPAVATPPAPPPSPASIAHDDTVPATIRWTRASAEHRALFLEIYGDAEAELPQRARGLANGRWGVILDADETVLDNSLYEQQRAQQGLAYTDSSWSAWVATAAAPALPGAVAFTNRVRSLGGRVVIVTNRAAALCAATRTNLERVGVRADAVLCAPAGASDKNPRFAAVQQGTAVSGLPALDVVMWVGDNIEDFPNLHQNIRTQADSAFAGFGTKFIVLPDPMYGSWTKNSLP